MIRNALAIPMTRRRWRNSGSTAAYAGLASEDPEGSPKRSSCPVRYSPEVVEYFQSTGKGWQTRMDEALKEWVDARRS
jgi:uncharacterized protein (DUF4415 family)